MLKSLYFKLNPENEKHKEIIDFFNEESDVAKVDLLFYLIQIYKGGSIRANNLSNSGMVGNTDITKNNKKG